MDFTSAYAHGFARIAACTMPISVADPASNAEAVLAEARACHDEGVAVAIFPELCLSGYAQEEDRRKALEAGFDAHLVKAADAEDLFRALAAGRPDAL